MPAGRLWPQPDLALRHQGLMLLLATPTVAGTVWMYVTMPKGFLPQQDTGLLTATVEAPDDVSFGRMRSCRRAVAAVIRADPDVTGVASVSAPASSTRRRTWAGSPPCCGREDRADDVRAIVARLQPKLDAPAGVTVHLQPVQDIQIGARPGSTPFQYTLMAPTRRAGRLGAAAGRALGTLPSPARHRLRSARRRNPGHGRCRSRPRRAARRDHAGGRRRAVRRLRQRQISTIYAQNNQYRVVLEATPTPRQPGDDRPLRVPATAGQQPTCRERQPPAAARAGAAGRDRPYRRAPPGR